MTFPKDIFAGFEPVSAKQWKQKIQFDLKGGNYNDVLLTHTLEGITINPFYHAENFRQLDIQGFPDAFMICQSFYAGSEKTAAKLAVEAVKRGAESVKFIAGKAFDFKKLLKDLTGRGIPIFFDFNFLDINFLIELRSFLKDEEVYFNIDIINHLEKSGNWFYKRFEDHQILKHLLKNAQPGHGILGVDVSVYQNAGANTVQQVAYALAKAGEYLNFLEALLLKSEISEKERNTAVRNMVFTFSTGYNYFFEIAKLRAFRYLWKLLLNEYQLDYPARIFALPSLRNKTLFDAHVNMLRTTPEYMSSVFGGADFIGNLSFDAFYKKTNEFGERISRNQLIILKEESRLKNASFAKGAYYIEELTYEIAVKALDIFKEIERSGGLIQQLFKGTVQRKIKENAQKEQKMFDSGKLMLVGTNTYPNKEEKIGEKDFEIYPFLKKKNGKTDIIPIIPVRLAEAIEQKRLTQSKV